MLPRAECPGLYVHIPFCFHKCHYCDFYSITRQTPERMHRFVELILREGDMWTHAAADSRGFIRPTTVFFGGGTPSLLPLEMMRQLIQGLQERIDFSAVQEWTVECNPATVSAEYAAMLHELGVDRLSFGDQSFDPSDLALLERHHDPQYVHRSVEIAKACGFKRLNIDLIYAVPGQTLEKWSQSLEAAIAMNVPHISCYALTYEANTPMTVRKRLGQFRAVEDDVELQMLHHTRQRLNEVGLPPYEISNYARAGEACQHNLLYWTGGNYVGLGPSAASHVEGYRFRNRPHLGEWETAVSGGVLPAADYEVLTPKQRIGEIVMLMLRLTSGVEFEMLRRKFDIDPFQLYATQLDQLQRQGLIVVTPDHFHLTNTGLNVADAIAAEFVQS